MKQVVINGQSVKFEVGNGELFITSLDIATVFEKRHADVLRAINLLPKDEFNQRNFALTYRDTEISGFDKLKGAMRKDPYYNLTRDGFALLAMGFNGAKAYQWKVAFINAFNQLEKALRENLAPSPSEITLLQSKLAETITALSEVAKERDEFRDKYLRELEREVALLYRHVPTPKEENLAPKKGTHLSEAEKNRILRLHNEGLNKSEIARRTGRSFNAITRVIQAHRTLF